MLNPIETIENVRQALGVALSDRKIVIHALERNCNRYPEIPGKPTSGCSECGLGEIFGKRYDPETDYATLDGDCRAFKQKQSEGALSITLLGGELLQDTVVKTLWPTQSELVNRYHISPDAAKRLKDYREKIGKPIQAGTPMEMWERDTLLPVAMIGNLGMIPHLTSNFDLLRPKKNKESRLEEIVAQLKIAGLKLFNASWHSVPGTALFQNREYFENLVTAIKYCEREAKIPVVFTRVFRGFKADPDIFYWQREVANRYITNDISPVGIRKEDRKTVFYAGNQELKPTREEVEDLGIFHLLNAMAGDQPRVKTIFQAIFEGVLSETGWRCDPNQEHFEFMDVTEEGIRSGVCSEVRGEKVDTLFPPEKTSRMSRRANLIRELCPSCLSRCYTYFEWRDFQKDALHLWHYAQTAGKIWRQMYGRERPFRHLVMRAEDYLNPDLLKRILQFRFRYFAQSLENGEVVTMLRRSGVDPFDILNRYFQEAVQPDDKISILQERFRDLAEFSDESSLQSRVLRRVAMLKHFDPETAPIPWKYIWILRREDKKDLDYHYQKAQAVLEGRDNPVFPNKGTILAQIINLFFPKFRLLLTMPSSVVDC